MNRRTSLLVILCAVLWHGDAAAHARSESYSNWTIDGSAMTGVVTVTAAEVMTLVQLDNAQALETLFAEHLLDTVDVLASGGCRAESALPLQAARGFLRIELRFECSPNTPSGLRYRALFDMLPEHVHFARFFDAAGLAAESVFTDRADTWSHDDPSGPRDGLFDFFRLGVSHIIGGIDHIAFLLGLLLVAGSLGRGVAAVTGFTLGHSLSLAAAVLGYVQADARLVEAFIGFTVALVAVEFFVRPNSSNALATAAVAFAWLVGAIALALNLVPATALAAYVGFGIFAFCYLYRTASAPEPTTRHWRGLLVATTCFGLVHGFGFAGFLMDTGIRGGSLFAPLLGFNIGVEVGQLCLLVVAVLLGACWATASTNS